MSNDEIERRLGDLEPAGPRPELRAVVLDAVQAELDSERATSRLDRLLARRATWAAAAILLLGLAVANVGLERGHAQRKARVMGAGTDIPQTERPVQHAHTDGGWRSLAERQAWLRRWMKGERS
jgi:hypothetical protein